MQNKPHVRKAQLPNGKRNQTAAPDAVLAELPSMVAQAHQLTWAFFKALERLPKRTCAHKDSCQGRLLFWEDEPAEQRDSSCPAQPLLVGSSMSPA